MPSYATLMLSFQDLPIAGLRNQVDQPHPTALRELMTLVKSGMLGNERMHARLTLASAVASQTITASASGGAPNDTLVVGGTTLTNKASPANENEFADAATDALLAASVVAAINAHSTISKFAWAAVTTSASGIFTVYSKFPGPIGNLITLAETGSGFTLTGSALTGGASDETDEFVLGFYPPGAVQG